MTVEHHYDECPAKPQIENFREWQERQNGSLGRIEKKVDQLFFATLSGMSALILALIGVVISLG